MARARIFTPTTELPFAGHPTIGAAVLVATLEAPDLLRTQEIGLVLEEAIGLLSCTVRHRRGEAAHARFEVPRLAEPWGEPPDEAEMAALLGLTQDEIGWGGHRPSQLHRRRALHVRARRFDRGARPGAAGTRDELVRAGYYLFARDAGPRRAVRTRMLARGLGVAEDPRYRLGRRRLRRRPLERRTPWLTATTTAASSKASRWDAPAASALP